MIEVDASEFDRFASQLDAAVARGDLLADLEPMITRAAVTVKDGMRFDMLSSGSFNAVADDINFDVDRYQGTTIRAEIGPVTHGYRVGDLAHFAYFGGSPGGGATVRDPEYWLDYEFPQVEKHALQIVDDLLGRLT